MRIATFGSCLSRYIANNYTKIFGGYLVSSVYHNRSDAFIGRFIKKDWVETDFAEIAATLKIKVDDGDVENNPVRILKNQYPEWMGKHRLSRGKPFLDLIRSGQVDVVIVDNYMDLAGRLVSDHESNGFFMRLGDFSSVNHQWKTRDYLSPEEGVKNMTQIIDFIRQHQPAAKIIFINFPHNTYSESPDRVRRTKIYEELFSYEGIMIIPCQEVQPLFQTKDKQHFKAQQYCAYAGMINYYVNSVAK